MIEIIIKMQQLGPSARFVLTAGFEAKKEVLTLVRKQNAKPKLVFDPLMAVADPMIEPIVADLGCDRGTKH